MGPTDRSWGQQASGGTWEEEGNLRVKILASGASSQGGPAAATPLMGNSCDSLEDGVLASWAELTFSVSFFF